MDNIPIYRGGDAIALAVSCLRQLENGAMAEAKAAADKLPPSEPFCDLVRGICMHAVVPASEWGRELVVGAMSRDPAMLADLYPGTPETMLRYEPFRGTGAPSERARISLALSSFGNMRLRGWALRTAHENGVLLPNGFPVLPRVAQPVHDRHLVCLLDGQPRKMLKRHLRSKYSMEAEDYLEFFDLPPDMPLVAPGYEREKARVARSSWPKAKEEPDEGTDSDNP